MIQLRNLKRFFPYESVYASDPCIRIEDKDMQWYNAIVSLLKKYQPTGFVGCTNNYFRLEMDNKITLELKSDYGGSVYITYWDNNVMISNSFNVLGMMVKYCTVRKRTFLEKEGNDTPCEPDNQNTQTFCDDIVR